MRQAEEAEITARREVDVQSQNAAQMVGLRTAEKDKEVGIANEQAQQSIKEQQRVTKEKEMAIMQVSVVKTAEITKEASLVQADEMRQTSIINADGDKQKTILIADGHLGAKEREAKGIEFEGSARASAETAMQLAPVTAQITLAKEIGENGNYQKYLITIRQVEKDEKVGIAQAEALTEADVKVISNTGDPVSGMNSVMDLFTSKGGTNLGAMLEGIVQSPNGKAVIERFITGGSGDDDLTI
jgi:flotillin